MTFGLTMEKLLLIGLIAVIIIGPERLPAAAESLRRTIQQVRRMARTAQDRVREELGPEVGDIDWQRLDPRQYDPRRIIREALLAEPEAPSSATAAAASALPHDALAPAVTPAERESPPSAEPPLEAPASPVLDQASGSDDTEPVFRPADAGPAFTPADAEAMFAPADAEAVFAPADAEAVCAPADAERVFVPADAEPGFAAADAEPAWEAVPVRARSTASVDLRAPLPTLGDDSSR